MHDTINQYLSFNAGNSPLVNEIQDKYGLALENLTLREKLFTIERLTQHLLQMTSGEIRSEIPYYTSRISLELATHDQENMIQALIKLIQQI